MGTRFESVDEIIVNKKERKMEVLRDGNWGTIRNIDPKYKKEGVHESVSYWGYIGVTIYLAPVIRIEG